MKRIVVVVVVTVLLALFAAAGWALTVVSQVQLRLARENAAELQQGKTRAEATLAEVRSELADCIEETARVQAESEEYLQRVLDLEDDAALCEELYTAQRGPCTCTGVPPEIDYTGQDTVSASLEAYIERNRTRVESADWYVIWEDVSTAAVHQLVGSNNVMYVYIAWLDDPEWQYTNRVFSIDSRCWLDPRETQ